MICLHLILRNRPDVVDTWSDEEVARRWLCLCPLRKNEAGEPEEPTDEEIRSITGIPTRLTELRCRLSDISWFMRMVAEPVARQANFEDDIHGRFWQGRFRAVKLCDEAALLACSIYVDLNPIRAGVANTPESSDFTSAQRRIEAQRQCDSSQPDRARPDEWLAPLPLEEGTAVPGPAASVWQHRCSDKGFLPMPLAEYLELLDWTGRQIVAGKRGAIPEQLSPILTRLGIETTGWFELASNFGRLYHRVAGGCSAVRCERTRHTARPFRCGHARLLGSG